MARIVMLGLCVLVSGCAFVQRVWEVPRGWFGADESAPGAVIDAKRLARHVEVLASDRFEGRLPGTRGEELTVSYLVREFRRMGLAPGNPDGTYVQPVPLLGMTPTGDAGFEVRGRPLPVRMQQDVVTGSPQFEKQIRVRKSEIVFVGYGVQAPEYRWDDFKGADLRGKTLLILVNDPPVPLADGTGALDPALFGGPAMTYYGRWTYKYEMAAELGAAAVLVIHETGPAGYPWEVVAGGWGTEEFHIFNQSGNRDLPAIQGWMHQDFARRLLAAGGHDYAELKAAAARRDFHPVHLPARASFQVFNKLRRLKSRNVVARVAGRDPALADQHLIYSAHWDHLGRNPALSGDQIYNGALDNATGTAGLLELARAFASNPPRRSVLFLAVTAEEQGLLGARYYAANPLYPLHHAVANINMDALNPLGPTRDLVLVGAGQSDLEDRLRVAAAGAGRRVVPEPAPEKGYYYRSDHFEFAKKGVPALYIFRGREVLGRPSGYGLEMENSYISQDYHKVSDEPKPYWDLTGAARDLDLLYAVGLEVADSNRWPAWKPGSEFRHLRPGK